MSFPLDISLDLGSVFFVPFAMLVCAVAYCTPKKVRYIWLLLCSYAFYFYNPNGLWDNVPALLLLIFATIVSYVCALAMPKTQGKGPKRFLLIISLLSCLGMLFVCKYYNFFTDGIQSLFSLGSSGVVLPRLSLVWPLGISYYVMQTVAYSCDVYFGSIEPHTNLPRYALFVSFFPSITIGPINRANDMLAQYKDPPSFNYDRIAGGLYRILWGFFKKKVLADNLNLFIGTVLETPNYFSGPALLFAGLMFAYQLYLDFGGSCDIAIGAAYMLGFDFMENFNRPFAAKTFAGLWQRWHISLTAFFRDYVFTPIVWSRWTEKLPFIGKMVKKPPMFTSTVIIFALSGLWHGPSWYYVIWGVLNGLILAMAKLFNKKREKIASKVPVYRIPAVRGVFQRIFVFLMFAGCLIFFAAAIYGFSPLQWFSGLFSGWDKLLDGSAFTAPMLQSNMKTYIWWVILLGAVLVEVVEKFAVSATTHIGQWIRTRGFLVRWGLYLLLLLSILLFAALGQSKFIYQQY